MPFRRLTLTEKRQLARAIFAAKLVGADATLKASNITVSADVMAALWDGEDGHLDWLAQQILPQSQGWDFLVQFGQNYGLSPDLGMASSGNALFSGTLGTNVPNGTELQDSVGNLYKTTATVALGAGTTAIPIVAETVGSAQNLGAGAPLTFTNAIAGVNASAAVDGSGLSGGADADSIDNPDAFRARVLARLRSPPGGVGNAADYTRWAQSAGIGVTRVGIFALARGVGTADIRFVIDGRANIVPTLAERNAVQAAIDANKPVIDTGVLVQTVAAQTVDYTLSAASIAAADRTAVADALAQLHRGLAVGGGLSLQAHIIPAVTGAAAPAGSFLTAPAADIAADATKVLTLGNIIYA